MTSAAGPDEPGTPDATAAPMVSRRRLVRAAMVALPLGGLVYALLASAPGFAEAGAALRGAPTDLRGAGTGRRGGPRLSMAQAYRSALAAVGVDLPYRHQLPSFVAGYGVGQLLPAGGAVGGAVVGQRMIVHGAPRAAAAAAVTLTGILSLLGVALLVSVGLLVTAVAGGSSARGGRGPRGSW